MAMHDLYWDLQALFKKHGLVRLRRVAGAKEAETWVQPYEEAKVVIVGSAASANEIRIGLSKAMSARSGARRNPTPPRELDLATNLFGHLNSALRSRLMAVIEDPNEDTWNNAYSIILDGHSMKTLWQSVIAVDPTFPKRGPATDRRGRVVEGWSRIPSRDLILRAIKYATH